MHMNKPLIQIKIYALVISLALSVPVFASNPHLNVLQEEFAQDPTNRSAVLIYKQDPQVKELGVRRLVIPTLLSAGPSNEYMEIAENKVSPNEQGDFIFREGTEEFDTAHTFAVAWATMLMYRQDLERLAFLYPQKPIFKETIAKWDAVGYSKLLIYPKQEVDDQNAFYTRYEDDDGKPVRELRFYSFEGEQGRVHTCQSLDVVSHETGHSVLDILHPEYFDAATTMIAAFHEAFGDLTAIFMALSQPDLCEALYADTKGDLGKESFLTDLAEQFGTGIGSTTGLRNLLEPVTVQSVDSEAHALSRVFTNAVYGILKDGYKCAELACGHTERGAKLIDMVGSFLRRLVLQTVVEIKEQKPTFSDFAFRMFDIAASQPKTMDPISGLDWATIIKNNFAAKGIPVEENSKALNWINMGMKAGNKVRICGTVHKCQAAEDK